MNIDDFILLIVFGCACYYVGKARGVYDIITQAVSLSQDNDKNTQLNSGELFIEKINDCYYAYVEQEFVEQATTFDELFVKLKQNKFIGTFTVKAELDTLSTDERAAMIRALKSTFESAKINEK
jgi:hypothetical protein